MNQQQINEVQHNLQTALIEPSQHIQTETVQQHMVMHYQTAPQSQQQQQIIVEHSSPSQPSQHQVIVQQNITPTHQQPINQQAIHQSQPIVIAPPQQNVVRQPYTTVYSQTQKRVYHTAVPQQSEFTQISTLMHRRSFQQFLFFIDVQMRTVPIVEQTQQHRILQMGQTIQKVPRLVTPSQHVTTVVSNPMPRVRASRPRLATTIQQSPRMVAQSPARVSRLRLKFLPPTVCFACH